MSSVAEGITWVRRTRPWAASILTGIVAETTMNSPDYGWRNKDEFKLYCLCMFVTHALNMTLKLGYPAGALRPAEPLTKYYVAEVSRAIESRMHRWGLQFHGKVRVLIGQICNGCHSTTESAPLLLASISSLMINILSPSDKNMIKFKYCLSA